MTNCPICGYELEYNVESIEYDFHYHCQKCHPTARNISCWFSLKTNGDLEQKFTGKIFRIKTRKVSPDKIIGGVFIDQN